MIFLLGTLMLELKLFSSGQVRYYEHLLPGFPNQQPYQLLCYLLLNKHHPHHREHLAAIFWGEYPTQKARKSLRNALWRLRQSLQSIGAPAGEYLMISDDYVSFINTSHYWLDVEIFETTTASYQDTPGQKLTQEQATQLEGAVDIYTGDLLDSVYEDWILYDRERLRLSHLNTLSKLLNYYGAIGNYERGLACGGRILALDETREKVHQQMMRLHCLAGDRNAALAQYKRCCQILREELGIHPMKETRQLYEKIMHDPTAPEGWSVHQSSPTRAGKKLTIRQPLAVHALQKLHLLQKMVDQTSAELHILERLISEVLTPPDQTT